MYDLLEEASNINQTNAKFKGHSYIVNPNNSTITFQVPSELLTSLIDNQQKIITLFEHQNQLVNDLLKKTKV